MSISNSLNILPIEYSLQTYHRSNQDTTLLHKPVVKEGDWVQAGDLISDSGSSIGGEFSIGQNLLIAYLPWEGYNYEDAILISEKLVYDDLYTSIHIERYDISIEKTPYGNEIITKDILLLKDTTELEHLDNNGVAKLGSWLKEGDILVGKITPTEPKKEVARYIQLYNDILGRKMDYSFRDTSLRMPRGLEAKVIRVQLFPEKKKRRTKIGFLKKKSLLKSKKIKGYKRRIEPSYLRAYYKGLEIKQNLFSRKQLGGFKKSVNFFTKEARKGFGLSLQHSLTGKSKFNKNVVIEKPIKIGQEKAFSSFSLQVPISAVNIPQLRSQRANYKYVRVVKELANGKIKTKKTVAKMKKENYPFFFSEAQKKTAGIDKGETQSLKRRKIISSVRFEKKRCARLFLRSICFFSFPSQIGSTPFRVTLRETGGRFATTHKQTNEKDQGLRTSSSFVPQKKNRKRRAWRYLLFSKKKAALLFTKAFSSFSKYSNLSHKKTRTNRLTHFFPENSATSISNFVSTKGKPRELEKKRGYRLSVPPLLKNEGKKKIESRTAKLFFTEWETERTLSFTQKRLIAPNRPNFEQKKQKELKSKNRVDLTRKSKELRKERFGIKESVDKPKTTSITSVHVYLAEKRKVQVGDKMAGRHGNKGIISQILPRQDMPYLPDGSPIDLALNPLGVPSRMNVGQIYECLLGLAGKNLGEQYRIKPFDEAFGSEASRSFVFAKLSEARLKTGQSWLFQPINPGKLKLFDGRTGIPYDQAITTGYSYMIKLVHLVDEKIHSRSSGPYSLITQQPLKGRSKHGGQRLGEMEVWAIEAYGAAFILLELLTIKSDDVTGRLTIWDYILYKKPLYIGTPASFKVLICELQALCLDIGIYKADRANILKQINVSTMG